eukprot:GEMP01005775.1.p1 GENE.GEMP01005775.1~~GEMP01005775.1.p1  ORF type:complete len:589 (+),score=100.63 GEMP01005775.1:48-1814(+)
MDFLRIIRSTAGSRRTVGLPDHVIEQFLSKDVNLALAIQKAHSIWKREVTPNTGDEATMIEEMQRGFCNFYPEDTRNPYIPSAAKGPWIVTLHGAVIHDNGGYGMLGFGHCPEAVTSAMSEDVVMANIMTASYAQQKFVKAIRREIGHARKNGCPYESFLLMNSGSEGNSVALRLIDCHTGSVIGNRKVRGVSLTGSFHGRTYKPALLTDSCTSSYLKTKAYSINLAKPEYAWTVDPNDIEGMRAIFAKAKKENVFIEVVLIESVMGEGNPGFAMEPAFYKAVRELTLKYDSMMLVDNIQAGLRCTGNLSIVDYEGFENLPPPDFEVFSKAINAGQFPVSCVALSARAQHFYRHGVYGNTMTGNPRACLVASAVLNLITPELRKNIQDMGKYAVAKFNALQKEYPNAIERVSGTGLLYAVKLNKEVFSVVAFDGAETVLRQHGIGVIHGGDNALRFTPHFFITKDEIDLQVEMLKNYLSIVPFNEFKKIAEHESKHTPSGNDEESAAASPRSAVAISLTGHLFDKNVINQVLNLVEEFHGTAKIMKLQLGHTRDETSEAQIQISCPNKAKELVGRICDVSKALGCNCF